MGKEGSPCLPLFIDRLSFVIKYTSKEHKDFVRKGLQHLKYDGEGHYAYDKGKAKYKFGMALYVEQWERVATLLIQADPKTFDDHFLRVEYNPATADPGTVLWLLKQVLPGGWGDIVTHGKFTRVDTTVDVSGLAIEDLLVCYPQMSRSRVFCKSGRIETYEMGAYEGNKHVVVYDKNAETKKWNLKHQIKKTIPAFPVTRIEIVLRPSMSVAALVQHDNPFLGLGLYEVPPLSEAKTLEFRLLVEIARFRGLHDTLLMLPEAKRKQFKTTLEKSACSWWKPNAVWAEWPVVLKDLLHLSFSNATTPPDQVLVSPA